MRILETLSQCLDIHDMQTSPTSRRTRCWMLRALLNDASSSSSFTGISAVMVVQIHVLRNQRARADVCSGDTGDQTVRI